jgi:hypothetical protein
MAIKMGFVTGDAVSFWVKGTIAIHTNFAIIMGRKNTTK